MTTQKIQTQMLQGKPLSGKPKMWALRSCMPIFHRKISLYFAMKSCIYLQDHLGDQMNYKKNSRKIWTEKSTSNQIQLAVKNLLIFKMALVCVWMTNKFKNMDSKSNEAIKTTLKYTGKLCSHVLDFLTTH